MFVALRHRDFRLLWVGLLLSFVGTFMQAAAILWHVSILVPENRRALALGMVGLARIGPVLTFSMISGVAADALNRRTLMLVTQSLMAILAGALSFVTVGSTSANYNLNVTSFIQSLVNSNSTFGGFALNLAAITAAICMGPEAHQDPRRRYVAAMAAGGFYAIVGLFGATVVGLFAAFPRELVAAIAGLALLATIGNGLAAALRDENQREPALVTFLVTASGLTLGGSIREECMAAMDNRLGENRSAVVPAVIVGLCLVVGLAIGGYFVGKGAARFRSDVRIVTVKGLVEREVKADQAVWTLGLRRASENLQDAHTRISADRDAAVAFLR